MTSVFLLFLKIFVWEKRVTTSLFAWETCRIVIRKENTKKALEKFTTVKFWKFRDVVWTYSYTGSSEAGRIRKSILL